MSAAATPPDLADRFALIVNLLRQKLAVRAAKDRVFAPLLLILWNRLGRVIVRFAAIAARQRAGRLRRPSGKPRHPRTSAAPAPPRDPLPRQRGWLVRRAIESVPYGNYLRLLLEEPEMQALIQQAPQLRRLIRPLWRMLHQEPPPPILQTPASAAPRKPRRNPRPRPGTPKRPGIRPASARSPAEPPAPREPLLPAWVPRLGRREPS